MSKLIDSDILRDSWLYNSVNEAIYIPNDFLNSIDEQPTVEAEPIVHAHWILLEDCSNAGIYCSACRKKCFIESAWYGNVRQKSPRCPNCGAHMDEEDEVL